MVGTSADDTLVKMYDRRVRKGENVWNKNRIKGKKKGKLNVKEKLDTYEGGGGDNKTQKKA